jgi:SecD/SecF fusion protein
MIFGILVGTYSSIFVAGPLLILFKLRGDTFQAGLGEAESPPAQPTKA